MQNYATETSKSDSALPGFDEWLPLPLWTTRFD